MGGWEGILVGGSSSGSGKAFWQGGEVGGAGCGEGMGMGLLEGFSP